MCIFRYGVDHTYLDELLDGSVAAEKPGGVIVCDHDSQHYVSTSGFDEDTYPCRVVVLPRFHSENAPAAERLRMRRGCMHSKLMVLHFDGGSDETRFLRIVISSYNLCRGSARINNNLWVHDFAPREPSDGSAQTQPCVTANGNPHRSEFECDLRHFLHTLLEPTLSTRLEYWHAWSALLDGFDLTPPPGVSLILSLPGRYSLTERARYGQWALARHLSAARLDEDDEVINHLISTPRCFPHVTPHVFALVTSRPCVPKAYRSDRVLHQLVRQARRLQKRVLAELTHRI